MIRPATPHDTQAIGKIYCLSWKAAYQHILSDEYLDTLTTENCTPKKLNPENNLVAEVEGSIVGLVNFGAAREEGFERWGEIRAIYLLPDYWDKGLGKALFTHATKQIRLLGYDRFYLWVLKDNARARRFYEKMGMRCSENEKIITIGGRELVEVRYERELKGGD